LNTTVIPFVSIQSAHMVRKRIQFCLQGQLFSDKGIAVYPITVRTSCCWNSASTNAVFLFCAAMV